MKALLLCLNLLLLALSARANVLVFIQATNGLAGINYTCTAGETVRAFALDVTVDRGQILGVTNYFRGPCTVTAQGWGSGAWLMKRGGSPSSGREEMTPTTVRFGFDRS